MYYLLYINAYNNILKYNYINLLPLIILYYLKYKKNVKFYKNKCII